MPSMVPMRRPRSVAMFAIAGIIESRFEIADSGHGERWDRFIVNGEIGPS
jgi:hypothetical protein